MTKHIRILILSLICMLLSNYIYANDISNTDKQVTYISIREVVAKPGIFQLYNGQCQAEITISSLGGFKILFVRQTDGIISQEAKDVTGIAWLTGCVLVYSVSPIYGNPGVYIIDCITNETRRIIVPKNIKPNYPNGSDYFELHRVSADKIYFYYTPDVDSVNFADFRSKSSLFQSNLDGSGMRKAVN